MNLMLRDQPRNAGMLRRLTGLWLTAFLAFGPSGAFATTWIVSPSGNDANDGTTSPFKTLTHALSVAVSGDIISALAGTYDAANGETFPLALKSGVEVNGAGIDTAIISPGTGPAFDNFDTPLSNTTRLSGFTLTHSAGATGPLMQFAVESAAMTPRIELNKMVGDGTSPIDIGIAVIGDSFGAGRFDGLIQNNTFTGFGESDNYFYSSGIFMAVSPTFVVPEGAGSDRRASGALPIAETNISPTISSNTFTGNASGVRFGEVYFYGYGYGFTGASSGKKRSSATVKPNAPGPVVSGVMSPTINLNTFSTNSFDVSMFYAGSIIRDFSPTISNNTSTNAGQASLVLFPSSYFGGPRNKSDVRNAAGTAQKPDRSATNLKTLRAELQKNGVDGYRRFLQNRAARTRSAASVSAQAFAGNRTFGMSVTGNTIGPAPGTGMFLLALTDSGDGLAANLTINDNELTGNGDGILTVLGQNESTESLDSILIQGNTVTGNTGSGLMGPGAGLGIYLFNGTVPGIAPKTATAEKIGQAIADDITLVDHNVITNNVGAGIEVGSSAHSLIPISFSCNVIQDNTGDGVVVQNSTDPTPDFGGGLAGSPGNNTFTGNGTPAGTYDFRNNDDSDVAASTNYWGTTDSATIGLHIFDKTDDSTKGTVNFNPPLASPPTTCFAAVNSADLGVVHTFAPATAVGGTNITYNLQVTNNGPGTATNGVLLDTIPAGATFVSASDACAFLAGVVRCNLGNLASGATTSPSFTVTTPNTAGPIVNSATVSSDTPDPDTGNNTTTATTTITVAVTSSDLVLSKTASPAQVAPGGQITFNLAVTNNGPDTATNVSISDPLPTGVTFVSASAGCTLSSGTVTCAIGTLANQQSATRSIVVTAPLTAGSVVNTATVTSGSNDPAPGNNSASGTAAIASPEAIPTVGEWGLIILTMLLALTALAVLRRQRPFER